MSGLSRFSRATLLAVIGAVCWIGGPACGGAVRVEMEVRARQIGPGEPLRVDVRSPVSIGGLEGRFLEQTIHFLRSSSDGSTWSAWTLVPLDQAPGTAPVEVQGYTADGREIAVAETLTVLAVDFPEEQLSVAPKYVEPPPEVQERLKAEPAKLTAIYARRREAGSLGDVFVRPVPGEPTSVFGTRRVFNGEPRSPHPGLDLRAATGTEVKGSGPGRVVLAQDLYYSGNTVILDHGGGLFTLYAHLSEMLVEEGQEVEAGRTIGRSGATGRVTGPHLHWGAKIGDRPFNPLALLDERLF